MRPLVALASALFLAVLPLRWMVRSASAQGVGTLPAQSLEFVLSGGELRWYRVYSPPGVPAGESRPVVFCFHGGGGNATHAIESYGVAEEAAARGWISVFPEGSGAFGGPPAFLLETWNAGDCCSWAMENGVDDVGFFADMLAKLATTHPVDLDRVFLTGMSNGGMMSYRIGVERPDLVTAVAPVAGALEVGPPTTPVPLLAVHGLLDQKVPFAGGMGTGRSGTDFSSQLESVLPFLAVNQGPVPLAPLTLGQAQLYVSNGPPAGADTWYFLALDGGHTWPGSAGSTLDPTDPVHTDVAATPLIFDFFALQ